MGNTDNLVKGFTLWHIDVYLNVCDKGQSASKWAQETELEKRANSVYVPTPV